MTKLLNPNTLTELVDYNEKIECLLNNIFDKISFEIPNSIENIDINIKNLNLMCDIELLNEKNSFKNKILEYIQLNFNNSIKNFIQKTGKLYLDEIFIKDYDEEITFKLEYIQNQFKILDEYLLLLIDELKEIDSYLIDSIEEFYYQLINFINDEINLNKINSIKIKKIHQFKLNSSAQIVEYFKIKTLNLLSNESFLNMFSEDVKDLISSNIISYPFTLKFSNIFEEYLELICLSNIKQKYQIELINKKDNIIEDIQKIKNIIFLKLDKLNKKMKHQH